MQVEVLYRPSYSLAVIKLSSLEEIRIEAGALVSMSDGVTIETKATGGFFKSLTRSVLGGESFFQNFFKAPPQGGEITVAPELPGDVFTYDMSGETLMVQAGSFMASETTIELNTKLSIKGFVSAEGFAMLEASGTGKLLLSSYGAIHERVLAAGERYTVDTTHLVAFPASMPVQPRAVGGLKSTLLGGEGLVVDLTGPGRLLMQTRSPHAFISWLIPNLPFKRHGES
jgi:uncharacterized protein (TIGR00266 family)